MDQPFYYEGECPVKLDEPIQGKRRYTDVLCFPLFLAYLVGMFLVGVMSLQQGDLNRITCMLDRTGHLCGLKNVFKNGTAGPDFTHQKFVYWLDPFDFLVDADISTYKSVCVEKCPEDIGASVCEYDLNYLTTYNVPLASAESNSVGSGPCYMILMETFPLHGKCIPRPSSTFNSVNMATNGKPKAVSLSDRLYNRVAEVIIKNWFRDYIIDIMNGWAILLCCGTMAGFLFTLTWIGALRSYASIVIWNSLVLVNVAAFVYTIFCYAKAGAFKLKGAAVGQDLASSLKDAPSGLDIGAVTGRNSFRWYGNVMAAMSLVLLLLTVVILRGLKKWIEEAVLCMDACGEAVDAIQPIQVTQAVVYTQSQEKPNSKQAQSTAYQIGKAMQSPKFTTQVAQPIKPATIDLLWERLIAPLFRPLFLITFPILFFTTACWLSILLYIISMCSIQQQSNGAFGFVWTWKFYVMVVYHGFGLVWIWQVINGFNSMVVAGSVSYYYWHRCTVSAPVRQVLVTALRFNFGSVIFGGLFFSPALLLFRDLCKYMNRILECVRQHGHKIPERLVGSISQSWSCIDNMISYFNEDALIFVAIKGKDYSASACIARERVKANAAFMFSASPDHLLLAGKVLVCFTCAICALGMSQLPVYSDMSSSVYIASPIFITLMTTVISYGIAHTLLQVYATTWRTLLLNLCEDCERFHGKPRFCPPLLMENMQKVMDLKANKEVLPMLLDQGAD